MKLRIGTEFEFEACHQLPGEKYGKCAKLHGHRYKLEIKVEGDLSPDGWICDFKDLRSLIQVTVIDIYDHTFLNEGGFYLPQKDEWSSLPTVEHVALHIWELIARSLALLKKPYTLAWLRLWETSKSYAEVSID